MNTNLKNDYERPSIRTLDSSEIWNLIGPAQGYGIGTLPAYVLDPANGGSGNGGFNRSR